MNDSPVMAVADVRAYKNLTPSGRPTATKAARSVNYYSYGRQADQAENQTLRGIWYGPDGQTSHEEALRWAKTAAESHEQTFQLLLSVREERLEADDYRQVVERCAPLLDRAQVTDYRLIMHDDTAYSHAHCLFFADQKIDRAIFKIWQQTLVRELTAVQAERAQEQLLSLQHEETKQAAIEEQEYSQA